MDRDQTDTRRYKAELRLDQPDTRLEITETSSLCLLDDPTVQKSLSIAYED